MTKRNDILKRPVIAAKEFSYETLQSYNRFVPNSERTKNEINEIQYQYSNRGYFINDIDAYWAWLKFSNSKGEAWISVTEMHDVPVLLNNFVEIKKYGEKIH